MNRKSSTSVTIGRPILDVSKYRGQWVAVHPRTYQVIGHGSSPGEAEKKAAALKEGRPLMYYVPKTDAFFVGQAK